MYSFDGTRDALQINYYRKGITKMFCNFHSVFVPILCLFSKIPQWKCFPSAKLVIEKIVCYFVEKHFIRALRRCENVLSTHQSIHKIYKCNTSMCMNACNINNDLMVMRWKCILSNDFRNKGKCISPYRIHVYFRHLSFVILNVWMQIARGIVR